VTPVPRPASAEAIAALVATRALGLDLGHPVRLAVDGPPWAGLDLADQIAAELTAASRQVLLVRVAEFLRPASLRLERGRDDPDAYYEDWIDLAALRREVLDPAGTEGALRVLPSLWDPGTDRATRADYVALRADAVVIVDGWFLLGAGLGFDLVAHVALSPAARQRRAPEAERARALPAFDRYDAEVRPAELADIVVRADDPRHPAVTER
jgi:hypothetical protein